MVNIKKLPKPDLIMQLYKDHYLKNPASDSISSHWKHYGLQSKVEIDNDGNLQYFSGNAFGDLEFTKIRKYKILHHITNLIYFSKLPFKKDMVLLSKLARKILNPLGYFLSYDCFRQIYSLCIIRKYLDTTRDHKFNVLMIGDGYGFLSALIKKLYPEATIILVDIGRTLLFQAVNLQRMFPDCKHVYADDGVVANDADFIYCVSDDVFKVQLQHKLIINIGSMQEMNYQTIDRYFDYIRGHIEQNNLFYCSNRQLKMLPGGEILEFFKYPWVREDMHYVEEANRSVDFYFAYRWPFIRKYDGLHMQRLTKMKATQ